MKRILFILSFIFIVFEGNAQIITNINIQVDCNATGYIVVSTDIPAAWFEFYQYDDVTMSYVPIPSIPLGSDSVVINSCGNIFVEVKDASFGISDDSTFFVSCPMETDVQSHENILCYGDSTGSLKHVVSGGIPFNPDGIPNSGDEYYNYSWYKDGILYSSGQNDTLLINLSTGQYVVNVTDLSGCVFQSVDLLTGIPDTSVIFQPSLLRIDSIVPSFEGCKGTESGSIEIWVKGGKRFNPNSSSSYDGDEYYHYYLLNDLGDTVARSEYPDSLNFLTISSPFPLAPEHVKFSGLSVGNYTIHAVDLFGCTFDSTIYVMDLKIITYMYQLTLILLLFVSMIQLG